MQPMHNVWWNHCQECVELHWSLDKCWAFKVLSGLLFLYVFIIILWASRITYIHPHFSNNGITTDETLLPAELSAILERMRYSADVMPRKQLEVEYSFCFYSCSYRLERQGDILLSSLVRLISRIGQRLEREIQRVRNETYCCCFDWASELSKNVVMLWWLLSWWWSSPFWYHSRCIELYCTMD